PQPRPQRGELALDLGDAGPGRAVHRRVALGDERCTAEGEREDPRELLGESGQLLQVLVLLAGQPDHQIELEVGETRLAGKRRRSQEVGGGGLAVERLAEPLARTVGRGGQGPPASLPDQPYQLPPAPPGTRA